MRLLRLVTGLPALSLRLDSGKFSVVHVPPLPVETYPVSAAFLAGQAGWRFP
jgi:hypothetical protein